MATNITYTYIDAKKLKTLRKNVKKIHFFF